jgi:Insect cuticle protein
MFRTALVALTLVGAATARPDGVHPHHPAPAYGPVVEGPPEPYQYQYGVADDYSGARFAASEAADGKAVSGSYTVHLPDGRVQTVTYTADPYNGYIADVKVNVISIITCCETKMV